MIDKPCTSEELYQKFRQKLKAFILSKTNDEDLAEDLVQDSFVKLTLHCTGGGDCTYPRSYLYTIAANVVRDYYRSADSRFVSRLEFDENGRPKSEIATQPDDSEGPDKQFLECLTPLVDNLPEPFREAVRLADIEGIPQQEISRRMNISLSGAKSRVQRGRQQLRDLIVKLCAIEHDRNGNITSCDPRH